MKKLYMVNTNAGLEMIFVDYDEKIVRIYDGLDGWQYDHPLSDVEGGGHTSSSTYQEVGSGASSCTER